MHVIINDACLCTTIKPLEGGGEGEERVEGRWRGPGWGRVKGSRWAYGRELLREGLVKEGVGGLVREGSCRHLGVWILGEAEVSR
jgi:hypothetical protein